MKNEFLKLFKNNIEFLKYCRLFKEHQKLEFPIVLRYILEGGSLKGKFCVAVIPFKMSMHALLLIMRCIACSPGKVLICLLLL